MNDYICTVCQKIQPKADGFCQECGGALQAVVFCDGCGIPLLPGAAFCRECGTAAPKAKPAAPTSQAAPPSRTAPPARTSPPPSPPARRSPPDLPATPGTPRPTQLPAPSRPRRAAPVQSTALAPVAPTPTFSATQAVSSMAVGGVGLALLASGGGAALGGVVALPLAFALSWRPLQYYSAVLTGKVVDWVWPNPNLRRRLLGE
jgi:hypothetical protein